MEHLTVDPCSHQMVPGSIPGDQIFAAKVFHSSEAEVINKRAHPDLSQGAADLQSAALATELCTHGF